MKVYLLKVHDAYAKFTAAINVGVENGQFSVHLGGPTGPQLKDPEIEALRQLSELGLRIEYGDDRRSVIISWRA